MNVLITIALVWTAALLLDAMLGELRRGHPLVAFGNYAVRLERWLNRGEAASKAGQIARGGLAWLLAVVPFVATVLVINTVLGASGFWLLLFDVGVLYFALGRRSLIEHARAVRDPLLRSDLDVARQAAGRIVSRDTRTSSEGALINAVVETGLENSNDAVFASLFWYALGGSAGVIAHRLSNTLDAMWGYRSARFLYFGRVAARMDDFMGFVPAQLLSLSHCLLASGRRFQALQVWRQGWCWKSINAGSVMGTGAAALGIRLGGTARYAGKDCVRPILGVGREPGIGDIGRCFRLQTRALYLWFLGLFLLAALGY